VCLPVYFIINNFMEDVTEMQAWLQGN